MEYTVKQFEYEFENAPLDKKEEIFNKGLVYSKECTDETGDWEQCLLNLKDELEDLPNIKIIEEQYLYLKDIERGILSLYKCIDPIDVFQENHNYYVKIDDVQSDLKDRWTSDEDVGENTAILDILKTIDTMKPLIWIYYDNGIGTPKKRLLFDGDFDRHFEKFKIK